MVIALLVLAGALRSHGEKTATSYIVVAVIVVAALGVLFARSRRNNRN
jgi:LPXTG-motif cell wall-anchored protein